LSRPEETIQQRATSELRASVEYLLEGTPWSQRESITTSREIEYWEVTLKPNARYTFWITKPAHRVSFKTS
jgi:hypothetical protein